MYVRQWLVSSSAAIHRHPNSSLGIRLKPRLSSTSGGAGQQSSSMSIRMAVVGGGRAVAVQLQYHHLHHCHRFASSSSGGRWWYTASSTITTLLLPPSVTAGDSRPPTLSLSLCRRQIVLVIINLLPSISVTILSLPPPPIAIHLRR